MSDSYAGAVARVTALTSMMELVSAPMSRSTSATTSSRSTSATTFATALAAASPPAVPPRDTHSDSAAAVVRIAEGEVGQAEQPPGSNDSPRIAAYRSAVAGAARGQPWCAYFASWVAAQAGAPIGDHGQGLGSVAAITDWARGSGRLSRTPRAGDLILFGTTHVGIVESVNPDGSLTTIEGNTSDQVARRTHSPSEATGFVELGSPNA